MGFSGLIQGDTLDFARRRRDFFDLETLFSEIVDTFSRNRRHFSRNRRLFSEIVDTCLFVERCPGELDNRRHVSTICEFLQTSHQKFVDSKKFVD